MISPAAGHYCAIFCALRLHSIACRALSHPALECYNHHMELLLPGYPQDNPILKGIASIAAGLDPEAAIAARDHLLATPFEFVSAALHAARWFPSGSPLLENLLMQATAAFDRTPPAYRSSLLALAVELGQAGDSVVLALATRWRSRTGTK